MRTNEFVVNQTILQLVGDMERMRQTVKTADIALFLGVTKPTARKYLFDLIKGGNIQCEVTPYRKYADLHVWTLTEKGKKHHKKGTFKRGYLTYIRNEKGIRF